MPVDLGPSPKVNVFPTVDQSDEREYGVFMEDSPVLPSTEDREIADKLTVQTAKNSVVLNWPEVNEEAESEYDRKIFAGAFPWLFPGGIGDYKEFRDFKITAAEWAKRLVLYKDGRFATDKIFSFYVLNYVTRRRNQDQGNFFVKKFRTGKETDVESIKERIRNGDLSFVNEISYWAQSVVGSDAYWRSKKTELYTWISHHIEMGNGAPNFFITLSCAEHHWPDILRLVGERIKIATGVDVDLCAKTVNVPKLVNDYCCVVQEYFQQRVELWLSTVGKEIFGIEHYWCRYEFAEGRGQIHCHLLAISNDKYMHYKVHELCRNPEKQATVVAEWAEKKIGLTANFDASSVEKVELDPVKHYFEDVVDRDADVEALKDKVMMHECSAYCLRISTKEDKEKHCELHGLHK